MVLRGLREPTCINDGGAWCLSRFRLDLLVPDRKDRPALIAEEGAVAPSPAPLRYFAAGNSSAPVALAVPSGISFVQVRKSPLSSDRA